MAKKARTGSAGGRQGLRVLATGRRNIYTKAEGIETCDGILNNLLAERRGESILRCTCKTYDNIPNSKSVQWHIRTERRRSMILGLFRTHQRYQPDYPWSKGEQQRHYSHLARPRQCLWLNIPQADWWSIEVLLHPRTYTGDHQWLCWWLATSILRWRADNAMTEVRERNSDWLHHLSSTIRNGHEPTHQRRQNGNQRTNDSLRDTPTI